MHTIKRQNDREWYVGRMVHNTSGGYDIFVPMFFGHNVHSALALASALNGGNVDRVSSENILRMCWLEPPHKP